MHSWMMSQIHSNCRRKYCTLVSWVRLNIWMGVPGTEFLHALAGKQPLGLWPIELRYVTQVSDLESWAAHACGKKLCILCVQEPTVSGVEVVVHCRADHRRAEQLCLCQIPLLVGNWYWRVTENPDLLPEVWGTPTLLLFVEEGLDSPVFRTHWTRHRLADIQIHKEEVTNEIPRSHNENTVESVH